MQDIFIAMTIYVAIWVVIFGWEEYAQNCSKIIRKII